MRSLVDRRRSSRLHAAQRRRRRVVESCGAQSKAGVVNVVDFWARALAAARRTQLIDIEPILKLKKSCICCIMPIELILTLNLALAAVFCLS